MARTLAQTSDNTTVKVSDIEGKFAVRLLEMGITPGQTLQLIRRAPTGYPIEIQVRGYLISLRREEAEGVILEE